MNASYEVRRLQGGDALISSSALKDLARVDAVVFDCDGTLIDVSRSYDATIIRTASSLIRDLTRKDLAIEEVGGELIQQIRRTGGFNSDWDLTYALSMFSAVVTEEGAGISRLKSIAADFASRPRQGWKSVDRYLDASGLDSKSLRQIRSYLGYPGNPLKSRLAATFDQVYYGKRLYEQVYGVKPEKSYKKGLIDLERIIITRETLDDISRVAGRKIAMATGRPFIAVEYTLRGLLEYFERDASVYIGDGDIFPELAPELAKFKKPSGESLVLARKEFGSGVLLYVGDSAEDRLMVRNAGAPDGTILFAGLYGSSFSEEEQISYFTGTGSDVVMKDVNQIPAILEMARN